MITSRQSHISQSLMSKFSILTVTTSIICNELHHDADADDDDDDADDDDDDDDDNDDDAVDGISYGPMMGVQLVA